MLVPVLSLIAGLVLLVWSADRFVDGAASIAKRLGMSPLLIGMVIVGFGTSAPEMVVSALASIQDNSGIAVGNAYGSNITNIALILGVTAIMSPILVQSTVLKQELPILTGVSILSAYLLSDGLISRNDAVLLLVVFIALMVWTIRSSMTHPDDALTQQMDTQEVVQTNVASAWLWLAIGLGGLLGSSQMLVWGAVEIAHAFNVSDLIIGLTIVAVGTSLPELASSIIAARKGEHDIALGNILGSNLFNTLAVIGLAGSIRPIVVGPEVLYRDMTVMIGLTVSLFVIGAGFRGRPGRINRWEGAALLAVYVAYTVLLVTTAR